VRRARTRLEQAGNAVSHRPGGAMEPLRGKGRSGRPRNMANLRIPPALASGLARRLTPTTRGGAARRESGIGCSAVLAGLRRLARSPHNRASVRPPRLISGPPRTLRAIIVAAPPAPPYIGGMTTPSLTRADVRGRLPRRKSAARVCGGSRSSAPSRATRRGRTATWISISSSFPARRASIGSCGLRTSSRACWGVPSSW